MNYQFTITTLSMLREEEEEALNSSNSKRTTQQKASNGKSQPALPRPPLTRYPQWCEIPISEKMSARVKRNCPSWEARRVNW